MATSNALPTKSAAPEVERRAAPFRVGLSDAAVQIGVLLALGALWEGSAQAGLVHPFLLPALSDVLERLAGDVGSGEALIDLGVTLYRSLAGFAIAAVIAIPIGVLMTRWRWVHWFCDPLISFGFPMPKIAFLPIFVLWFDIYDTSKIIMVAFNCFFPIVSATYAGTSSVDKWPVWSARSLGVKEEHLLWEVIMPLATPQIITGLQIALPVAMITTVVSEMLMGGRGIGGSMITAGRFADSVGVFAGIVEIAVLGFVVIRGLDMLRARLLVWHPEEQKR